MACLALFMAGYIPGGMTGVKLLFKAREEKPVALADGSFDSSTSSFSIIPTRQLSLHTTTSVIVPAVLAVFRQM